MFYVYQFLLYIVFMFIAIPPYVVFLSFYVNKFYVEH